MKKRLIAVAAASLFAAIAMIGTGPSTSLATHARSVAPGSSATSTTAMGNDWELLPRTNRLGNDWE